MTRSELVESLSAEFTHLNQYEVEKIVQVIFDEISNGLAEKRRVELRGFGAFFTKEREGREARNPRTGQKVLVNKRFVPAFRCGKGLFDKINEAQL